jgi:hypothetical protein
MIDTPPCPRCGQDEVVNLQGAECCDLCIEKMSADELNHLFLRLHTRHEERFKLIWALGIANVVLLLVNVSLIIRVFAR